MKTTSPLRRSFAVTALSLAAVVVSPAAVSAASGDAPNVNVTVRSEGEALARGFEKAFETISGGPVFLTYSREDKGFVTIAGVRAVEAVGSVLIIRTDRGTRFALPAASIVTITDERPSVL